MKPEAVEVRVPVYVKLPAELTEQVPKPMPPAGPLNNADIADLADARGLALDEANGKLARIRALQPKEGTDVAEAR